MADEKHETITDVVRKMRNEIAELRKVSPNVPSIAADWWEARADEIEAAHKREIEATAAKCCQLGRLAGYGAPEIKHQQESVGDAAKLREALLRCDAIAHFPEVRDYQSIKDMRNIIKHALAAPPRNCDKVKTSWDVLKKWHEGLDTANAIVRMLDWLLAPATEKEGGDDADK